MHLRPGVCIGPLAAGDRDLAELLGRGAELVVGVGPARERRDAGLPIGFQVMAPALGEEVMYQVAAEVERIAGFSLSPPAHGAAS